MENINDFVIFLLPTVVRLSWSAFIHGVCSRWAKNMFVQLSLAALICVEMATWTPWPRNQQQKKFQPPQPRNNNKVINDHVANSRACSEAQPNNATQTLRKNNVYLQTEWNTMDMQNNLFLNFLTTSHNLTCIVHIETNCSRWNGPFTCSFVLFLTGFDKLLGGLLPPCKFRRPQRLSDNRNMWSMFSQKIRNTTWYHKLGRIHI